MINYSSLPTAGILRRLGALVYDALLVMAISMAWGGITVYLRYGIFDGTLAEGEKAQSTPLEFFGLVVVLTFFFCFFWHRAGQTLGMRAWRLRLQQTSGQLPNWRQCLLRSVIAPCSIICAGLGYLWCLLDPKGDSAHDRLGNLKVVVLPKDQ